MYDLLSEVPGISSKAMFGGYGIYLEGLIVAIIADGKLWGKVGDTNKEDYQRHGSQPFVYSGKNGKSMTMSYWEIPADVLEDRFLLQEWLEKSFTLHSEKK